MYINMRSILKEDVIADMIIYDRLAIRWLLLVFRSNRASFLEDQFYAKELDLLRKFVIS